MQTELAKWASEARFTDKRNITLGLARVIWAPACRPIGRDPLPDGWNNHSKLRVCRAHGRAAWPNLRSIL